ncbi:hypothetical protein UFOVP1228_32 [uncultured Caudovirales phage]|uniref:Uncharacterized protein n=1 Tax=uncultured Caudovirales phage TaxID=2100421 RepID=A0A6J5R2I9_9CAUD|nr:hypothetical protein UFOVP956_32 [uncultured Caudovirales phage]CAB4191430.1 hypothetical protein UFOVP1228_32 [uncultured Caudovirales phage]CAB4215272.1 hypothetical protein UFOVP1481_6 [uncultured Caudovirales phage]
MPTAEELAKMAGGLGSSLGGAVGSIWGPVGSMAGSALGSVGGALIGSIPSLIKSDYEKENAKRLADLKRRQELGTLGFTEEEKQSLYNAGTSATEKAAQDMRALQSTQAAALATGAGQAGIQSALQQEQAVTARAALERDLQAKNLEEKRALQNEIEQRQALASEAKARKQAAAVSIAQTGIGSLDEAIEHAKTVRGAKPTPDQLDALAKTTGMDPNQISSVLDYMASASPEMQQLFGSLMKPSTTGAVPGYRAPIGQ